MSHTTTAQTFTAADLAALDVLASRFGRPVAVDVCADDGDAWVALMPVERRKGRRGPLESLPAVDRRTTYDPMHGGPLASVQTTTEPGRRLVVLAADGRTELAAGDDLADLVPLAKQ